MLSVLTAQCAHCSNESRRGSVGYTRVCCGNVNCTISIACIFITITHCNNIMYKVYYSNSVLNTSQLLYFDILKLYSADLIPSRCNLVVT